MTALFLCLIILIFSQVSFSCFEVVNQNSSVAVAISRSHVDHSLEPGPGDSPDLGPGGGGGDVQAVQDRFLEVGDG